MKPYRYSTAIRDALSEELERDETVMLLGIDLAAGGILGVTRGLADTYGTERVRDTPISEMGFVGAAVGAAMTGLRPVVEIMFMDFLGVCLDALLNQAAKLRYMTGGAVTVPVVFRTQTGAGQGAGAQHSQSLEAMVASVPGLKVVTPGTVTDAHDLLVAAIRDPNPVVFVENRRLYSLRGERDVDPLPLGRARVARRGEDVTVVTWGQYVPTVLTAADECRASVEVIDLRSLVPLDLDTVLESTARTGHLLVVHEAVESFGPGAEIVARVAEWSPGVSCRRLAAADVPMPYAETLEKLALPQADEITKAAEELASVA
jgi:pyruvate/2-oxoglutarate/acetoin dehydrogenase E1 component